jgi:uncharacterized protein YceK
MERKYVVLFCLLAIVLLSGCSVILYPKSTTENYKLGYQDGLMAAYKSTEGATHGLIGENYYTPSKLPDPQHRKINDKPLEYQRGFTDGWRRGVDNDVAFYDWVYNEAN